MTNEIKHGIFNREGVRQSYEGELPEFDSVASAGNFLRSMRFHEAGRKEGLCIGEVTK
jgi:hypothetical protein